MERPTYDQATIAAYETDALQYDDRTTNFWKRFARTLPDAFIARLGDRRSVLDVGCGPGRDGVMLEELGCEVVGVDMSSAMLAIAAARGLTVRKGDLFDLPFEDAVFDGVWAYTSLLHCKKWEMPHALAEIRRVLRPGGMLALGMHQGDDHGYRVVGGVTAPRWFSHYERKELDAQLEHRGFEMEFFERVVPGRNTTYLHYVLRRRD